MNTSNIIILSSSKAQAGGVERFSFYLKKSLEDAGHSVVLLGREDLTPTEAWIVRWKKRFGFEHPALGYFLGRQARKIGFDVCITNGMLGWNLTQGKIINVQHSTFAKAAIRVDRKRNYFKYLMKRYVWGYFEGLAGRRATRCVAVSEETRESVMKYYGVKKVMVIPNATDTNLFKPSNGSKSHAAIFVGRFEPAKGKEILEHFQAYLHEQVKELVVAEHYSQKELAELYNSSEVFLLPSLHEGCSYALLDAMACGLPFLASPVGMVPELEKGNLFSGCIVYDQTVSAYVSAYENLMRKTNDEKSELSKELRAYILANHDLKDFEKSYATLIASL